MLAHNKQRRLRSTTPYPSVAMDRVLRCADFRSQRDRAVLSPACAVCGVPSWPRLGRAPWSLVVLFLSSCCGLTVSLLSIATATKIQGGSSLRVSCVERRAQDESAESSPFHNHGVAVSVTMTQKPNRPITARMIWHCHVLMPGAYVIQSCSNVSGIRAVTRCKF